MVDVAEEEYESDPEQAKLSLKMRRRKEASDDEEEEEDSAGKERRIDSRVSDSEYDGQGAAAEYDDEESDLEEKLLEEVEEEEFGERCGGGNDQGMEAHRVDKDSIAGVVVKGSLGDKKEYEQMDGDEDGSVVGQGQEEKKENEPFTVPTAGAFYMHDDRFRASVGGRHRQTLGGRNLWESRDDKKWGHDKFEEMAVHERHYNKGRRVSRGRNQARGRIKGEDREYLQENRPKAQDNNNQNSAPKSMRGKGPRRYGPATNDNIETPSNNRRHLRFLEKDFHANTGRASTDTSTSESAQIPSRKNAFPSNLSYTSPPFYPSGSSIKAINPTQKRDAQSNNIRGKSVSDSLGMEKLNIDDSTSSHSGKHLKNLPSPTSGPFSFNRTQPVQVRNKGKGQSLLGQMTYLPVPPRNQANRVPLQNQFHAFQQTSVDNQPEPNFHPSGQQSGSRSASGSQASSTPKNLHESTELVSHLESNNSKMALVGKGKGGMQSNGMVSFPYAGAQVMTTSGIGGNHGNQNFPETPTFLPVMQFAGQHRGGIGVPAVGMAFPGYVAQPNGMGSSEMTWLPVLAGAAGGLGATYGSQYITMASSLAPAPSKDDNIYEPGNKVKSTQKSELANDELGQRQNKARRYTEMKFDQ